MMRARFPDLHRLLASSAIIQAVGLAITIVIGIQLARYLGPAGYGIYGVIMAVVSIVTIGGQFGLPSLAIREAAAASSNSPHTHPGAVIRWFLAAGVTIGFLAAAGTGAAIYIWSPPWIAGRGDLLAIATSTAFLLSLVAVMTGLFRGLGQNLQGQTLDALVRPALIAAALFILHRLNQGLAVADALLVQFAANLIVIAYLLNGLWKWRSELWGDPSYSPDRWLAGAVSLFSTTMLLVINANYPLLIAGLFVGADDLGIFRVALASAALVALPTSIANISMGPVIAKLHRESDYSGLASAIAHTTIATFLSTAGGLLFLLLAGRPLIAFLFGPEYTSAYYPLVILGIAQLVVSAFGTAGTYLNLTGQERLVVNAFAASVPIGLVASVPLTAHFGINGAALGNVVMVIIWHWYVLWLHRRRINVPLSILAAWRHTRRAAGNSRGNEGGTL